MAWAAPCHAAVGQGFARAFETADQIKNIFRKVAIPCATFLRMHPKKSLSGHTCCDRSRLPILSDTADPLGDEYSSDADFSDMA